MKKIFFADERIRGGDGRRQHQCCHQGSPPQREGAEGTKWFIKSSSRNTICADGPGRTTNAHIAAPGSFFLVFESPWTLWNSFFQGFPNKHANKPRTPSHFKLSMKCQLFPYLFLSVRSILQVYKKKKCQSCSNQNSISCTIQFVFPWYLYQKVTQNILRSHEGKYLFQKKKSDF